MITVEEFYKKHNALVPEPDECIKDYIDKARMGLKVSGAGPFTMTPSYVHAGSDIAVNKSVVVIDAGGTNLRIAKVHFNDELKLEVEKLEKYPMLGTQGRLTIAEFSDRLADYLLPFVKDCKQIGFVFSFPCEILPDCDGRIINFDKEVDIPDAPGHLIGRELNEALHKKGVEEDCEITILNDTITTLLGGVPDMKRQGCNTTLGMILGTGYNLAYIEKWKNIEKVPEMSYSPDSTAINMESGCYDGMPDSTFDVRVREKTDYPDRKKFEKMISGAYQGMVVEEILKTAAEEGLFSDEAAKAISEIDGLTAIDVAAFITDEDGDNLLAKNLPRGDKKIAEELIDYYYRRIACLTAIAMTATISLSYGGEKSDAPACVVIDGSTYYKSPKFRPYFEQYMKEICEDRYGYKYVLTRIEDGNLSGAASAVLMR